MAYDEWIRDLKRAERLVRRTRKAMESASGGEGGGGLSSVADLSALDSLTPADGDAVLVHGRGMWRYDATSEAYADAMFAYAPDRTIESQTVPAQSFFQGQSLDVPNAVLGSMTLAYNDAGDTFTDALLSGHMFSPADGPTYPLIDHKAGTFTDYYTRLQNTVITADKTCVIDYEAASPGRWLWEHGPKVTASEIGVPLAHARDAICWALNRCRANGVDTLVFDGWYGYIGPIEIPHGFTLEGGGLIVGDGVIDYMRSDADPTDPRVRLDANTTVLTHHSAATRVTLRGIEFDGNWSNNDGFLTDPAFDLTAVSNDLRNSPTWCAMGFSNHGGRDTAGLQVFVEDVHAHDYGGSLMINTLDVRVRQTGTLRLGNTASGRALYGAPGDFGHVEFYGYTRTSFCRAGQSSRFGYLEFKDGAENPWPENANQETVFGQGGDFVRDEDPNLTAERYATTVEECYFDMRGWPGTLAFENRGDGFRVKSGTVRVDGNQRVLRRTYSTPQSDFVGFYFGNVVVHSTGDGIGSLMHCLNAGTYTGGVIENVTVLHTGNPTPDLPAAPPTVPFQFMLTGDNDQSFNVRDVDIGVGHQYLVGLQGLDDPDRVPTRLAFDNVKFHNVNNVLISWSASTVLPDDYWPGIEIPMRGCTFNLYDPAQPFVGDLTGVDRALRMMKLSGCRNRQTGRVSEVSGYHTHSTGGKVVDIPWNLMYWTDEFSRARAYANVDTEIESTEVTGSPVASSLRVTFRDPLPSEDVVIMYEGTVNGESYA